MKLAAVAVSVLVLSALAAAQSKVEKEVLDADAALHLAVEKGDVAAYDKLSADDFTWVRPDGSTVNKAQRLELIKRGPAPGFKPTEQRVRVYGDTAIVMGQVGQAPGTPVRYSRVWVKQNGQWRAVLNHVTLVTAR